MGNVNYRIDDRLIHGQVITAWTRYYKLEKIIIVDDRVAVDPIQRQIIKAVAPPNIVVDVLSVKDGYSEIVNAVKAQTSTLVLVKGPEALASLIEMGIDIKEVIIGGMQFKSGRKQVTRTVSVTPEEAEEFWKLHERGVELTIQLVPTERRSQLITTLNKTFPRGGQ
ncbi:MAG: PTS system mannose/fructose/N-acetylgalactosamine-transporter subunit IIB [Tepidanaerobacteraceae bacterium]|jgi:PTS system sorbose-specific IIB component